MNKLKIHELAKELNVTSKRLMEKLEEINIHPKSHMTTLEDDELAKLYKHIGMVNRINKGSSAPSQSDSESKSDHADNAARKNAPRIIRKTEVIIRDEQSHDTSRDKKPERRNYIRSSDSNDGLMAGYTRGAEQRSPGIRKRPRPEDEETVEKRVQESAPPPKVEAAEPVVAGDKPKKPVDDILSIKKVSHVTDKPSDSSAQEPAAANEPEFSRPAPVQEAPRVQEKPQAEEKPAAGGEKPGFSERTPQQEPVAVREKEKVQEFAAAQIKQPDAAPSHKAQHEEAPVKASAGKEQAEVKISDEDSMERTSDLAKERTDLKVGQQAESRPDESKGKTDGPRFQEKNDRPIRDERQADERQERPRNDQPRSDMGRQQDGGHAREAGRPDGQRYGQGYQGNREGGYQGNRDGQRQGEWKPREGGYQGNREGGYQGNRDGQRQGEWKPREGGYQGNREGGYQGNRDGGAAGRPAGGPQGGRQGEWKPREGGGYQGNREGGYQGNREGGYQGNRQGGYQGNREGGYQGNREGGYQGNRDGQRQGEWKPREGGGYQGNREGGYQGNREGGYQGNRQGGYQGNREGGYQGNREGGYQGNRQGGYQGNREGGYQGNREGGYQGNRDGGRPGGYSYGRDQGGRPGDGRQGGYQGNRDGNRGGNRPLVIPKATAPAGVTEEKVFTRGERRTFQTVEKQKEEKKEQKKDTSRTAAGGSDKDANFKKNIVGQKASVSDMYSDDFVIDVFYNDADEAIKAKRAEKKLKKGRLEKAKYIPPKAVLTDVTIPETVTVKELAEALKKTAADVIKKLFLLGIPATQNQELDFDTAVILGEEYGVKVHKAVVVSEEDILFDDTEDQEDNLKPRAPVVVVMGHVDHGKTSLLDAIRSANIAESEAGGITQHIGAYTVNLHGRDITFLDTPGHEAFTAMRARGAQVTDIAILVVAADDGVMPQTVEAINHAKAAGISIIVAINKIDKPNANPDHVKQELTQHGLLIEEWGGDVIAVPVSAKQRINIDQLLEMVLLTADISELKANPDKQAKGTVIEAQLDKNRGPVATLLVQRGTLRHGDAILSGSTFGRIRSMVNDKGRKIKEAGPSVPVEVFGLSDVPEAGEVFYAVSDEKVAKQLADRRRQQIREEHIGRAKISLEDLFSQIQQGNVKDLNLIVKADVQGSLEALKQSLEKISNDEVKVKVIHGAVGAIIEADITLAEVSNAIVIGFNVRPSTNVTEAALTAGVDIKLYRVIYDAIEDVQKAMKGMLAPTYKEVVDGHVEIRQLFKVSNVGTIGGAYVTDGKVSRNSDIRLVRDGIVVLEGKLASLKRFKDDAKEVAAGYECGVMLEKYNDLKEGDIIEAFHMEEVQRQ